MRRTIRQLAEEIRREWPNLDVKVERGHCNTDRKIPGTRLRHPGRGRWGSRIIVRDPKLKWPRNVILDHNNAETYRRTEEVVEWMDQYRRTRSKR
jgi:hypothetical protein